MITVGPVGVDIPNQGNGRERSTLSTGLCEPRTSFSHGGLINGSHYGGTPMRRSNKESELRWRGTRMRHDRGIRRYTGSSLESSRKTAMSDRDSGLRRIRRLSNWSFAALVVGVGATAGALARTVPAATAGTTAVTNSGQVTSTAGGVAQQAPSVHTPVATTSASGVTTSVSGASGVTASAGGNGRSLAGGSGDS